jgi:hypothetical protein
MYSKNLRLVFCAIAGALTLSSCGWVQDKPKQQMAFKSESLDLSCLNDMPTKLQNLFEGTYTESEADQEQLASIWACLDKSLNTFARHTTGAREGVYTSRELREFANHYLPRDRLLNEKLTDSIFKLKRAVLGGTDVEITQNEISSLRGKLSQFGKIIQPFASKMGILLHSEGKTEEQKKVASQALSQFVLDVADLLSDSVNPVAWNDLNSFITELDVFSRVANPTGLTAMKEQLPLFQYFKLLVVGGNEDAIERAKWRPIFEAVSHFYNALFLTNNTSDLLESLSIEIDSTEVEQRRAVEKITGLLKVLKNDPDLYSKRPVEILADNWAKVLLLNSFLFPRSQGSLALKPFLGSTALRKLAGYIVDQAMKLKADNLDPVVIQALTDNAITLVEQAAVANATQVGVMAPFSFSTFKEYIPQVKPLLKDPATADMVEQAADALKNASVILVGKESDALTTKDLRALIQKGSDTFLAWNEYPHLEEAIAQSFEILLRSPSFYSIQSAQIDATLDSAQKFLNTAKIKNKINWPKIAAYIHNGLNAKSILFANSEKTLSSYELKQLSNLWEPFRKGIDPAKNLGDALADVANVFKNSPFSSAKISAIVPALDAFLPENQTISKLGFTHEQLGQIKAMVVGGSNTSIERGEYTDLARIASAIVKGVYPVYQTLPKDFKPGLDSRTFALVEAGLQSMIDARGTSSRGVIPLLDLKNFAVSYLNQAGYPAQDKTFDTLLTGVNHRLFQNKKTPKPLTLSGSITMEQLKPIVTVIHGLKLDLADFETAFKGVPNTQTLEQKAILGRLTLPETKEILNRIEPILKGGTGLPYFTAPGKKNTNYYLEDLAYKAFMYQVMGYVIPAYKLDADTATGEKGLRLAYNDVVDLLNDINDVITELRMTYGVNPPKVSAKTRMQTINLFTQSGNGDEYIDRYELMEFLTMASAGKILLDKMIMDIAAQCQPQARAISDIKGFTVQCLKSSLFTPAFFSKTYGPIAPEMTAEYMALSPEKRTAFQNAVLSASAPGWTETSTLYLSDMETLASVPYYAENIFEKMDHNFDGTLNFTEAMSAFPVFCKEIKKAAGPSVKGSCEPDEYPGQVEAVYGYLLFNGEPPRGIKPGDSIWRKLIEAKNFLLWVRSWNRMDRSPEVRDNQAPQLKRGDLLSIISNLSATIAPAPATE